ncbi:ATP-dependent DNA helicase Q-like 3 isoform X2 [Phoenix dactylifera]|nr:ATP-dependent DNA helicase Q-like 3 isoform X2 [Phoenix dactylifera]
MKGIPAEFLSSTQTAQTKEKIHEDLNSGKPSIKLLYVTPELVALFGFMTKLTKLYNRGLLSLIAIDEAHCISTWGHDFRPSYRKLSSLRRHLPDVPILALTATAVPKVQKDVIESLCLQHPLILRASFNRPNIFYEVRYKDLLADAYRDVSHLLKSAGNACSIVYCFERSICDDLSGYLCKNGISSAAYHAGLNSKFRSAVVDDWLSSRIQVIVATVAFGMGIDKKDVRIVCHFNIPKSMEGFYQESGRAGRDQLPSRSVLYYGMDDRKRMEFILRNATNKKSGSSPSSNSLPEKSLEAFSQMVEYCEGSSCRRKRILDSFGEEVPASLCRKSCDACKHPDLVSKKLEDLRHVSDSHKKDRFFPIIIKSSKDAFLEGRGQDTEFWNREDEGSFSSEDISDSDDGAEVISSLTRSKISTKAVLDEKFEVLQHAEEVYYQNQGQRKQESSLTDKKAISETLREASKKRLFNALTQAQGRLGDLSLDFEGSAIFLEMDCFKKYEKVGKTFYNSQVAATVRWLSSSSHEQILDRLNANSTTPASTNCKADNLPTVTPPPDPIIQDHVPEEASAGENQDNINLEHSNESVDMRAPGEKIELPQIPSFLEFINQKRREGQMGSSVVSSQHPSRGVQKRILDSQKHGANNASKRIR